MMAPNTRVLSPDEAVLSQLFPFTQLPRIEVLNQSRKMCTFKAQFDTLYDPRLPPATFFIRLECKADRKEVMSIFERLATLQVQYLLPPRFRQGTVTNQHNQTLAYSDTECCKGVLLESVWHTLDEYQQSEMMDSIVEKFRQLHALNFQDDAVRDLLMNYIPAEKIQQSKVAFDEMWMAPMGNLDLGFHNDFLSLFKSMITNAGPNEGASTAREVGGSIIVASNYEDLGQVQLFRHELEGLRKQVVLCHNDLEPRNVFVHPSKRSDVIEGYSLEHIVDWEKAGIFPFAYEYAYKDAVLGTSRESLSWYNLFKQKMAALVPSDASSTKFMQAVRLIHASAERLKPRNFYVMVRRRWLEHHRLEESSDIRKGWISRNGEEDVQPLSVDATRALETEVLKELGRI